mgnify:FL=1
MSVATRAMIFAGVLVSGLFQALPAWSAELVMLEQPGCVWCKRWNEEIGIAYPKTSEGRQAPLRRVDITDAWPQDLAGIPKERMTPTFILVADGVEIDRLRGYPGEHFFWPLLTDMLGKLPDTTK